MGGLALWWGDGIGGCPREGNVTGEDLGQSVGGYCWEVDISEKRMQRLSQILIGRFAWGLWWWRGCGRGCSLRNLVSASEAKMY